MPLPSFFIDDITETEIVLDEETSRHLAQVLRMHPGERIMVTDGKGASAEASIKNAHKKHSSILIINKTFDQRPADSGTIAVSLVKNASRFEWFLEKATELGVSEIIPLICERTERQKFRFDRCMSICRSAMLQSMQSWLPRLQQPANFTEVVSGAKQHKKFIAHCTDGEKQPLAESGLSNMSKIILIGPEGDFTQNEINLAVEKGFQPVSLGATRLRTETAALYSAALFRP